MIRIALGSAVCLLILVRCNPTSPSPQKTEQVAEAAAQTTTVAASTARMAAYIAKAFSEIDHKKTAFFTNEARLEYFRGQMESPDFQTRINAWSFYANELLNGGFTEQAIQELQPLIQEIQKMPNTEEPVKRYTRLLAIAYLRLGEQANCINQRNQESCIIPISPKAQFQMTQGSETAMQLCTDILNRFGKDEETMWILNLAAMTIGQYPDGVPEKWRVPESHFNSGKEFRQWTDISQRVGIRGQSLSGGSCMEDFDGDGWLDIITSSWGPQDPLTFWKNDGKGGFINASDKMGLDGINGGLNMIHGDINNDGLPDILVLRGSWLFAEGTIPNSLLLNEGNGHFRDIAEEAGVLTFAPTQTAAFADFNLDGWIDFFVGNESTTQGVFQNEFYLNNGNGTFRNVINDIGVNTIVMVKGCTAGDINNDGWPDLYLSNYVGANLLLLHKGLNAAGVPQFENIAKAAGVEEPVYSFPTWIWDFNNDGWEDIFVSGYGDGTLSVARDYVRNALGESLGGHPRIYQNKGNSTFADVSKRMGMKDNIFTMGCNYGDLDADGYLDFYLGTGNPEYSSTVPHRMFHNNGGKNFEDVTTAGRFGHIQKGHAVAFGDLDRDGDEDLFESIGGAFAGDIFEDILFENPMGQDRSWIVLKLLGVQANRLAIGTRVKVTVKTPKGKRSIYRTVSTGGSFGSSSLQLEIGLNDATAIEEIEIIWPIRARTKQIFRDVELNRYIRIIEGTETLEYLDLPLVPFK